jgi:hypothetical protein
VLSYLDALSSALVARDRRALGDLLTHPLVAALPEDVRTEIDECVAGVGGTVPLRTLHFYYQQVERARLNGGLPRQLAYRSCETRSVQIELPLSAA